MDLTPWTTHDLPAQEQAGYEEGGAHCRAGWCVDNTEADTPFMKGYRRGWDDLYAAGLNGTTRK